MRTAHTKRKFNIKLAMAKLGEIREIRARKKDFPLPIYGPETIGTL